MKRKDIELLLKAARAKSKIETSRLAVIRAAQERLFEAAARFETEAMTPLVEGRELTGAELALYGRRLNHLGRAASKKREAAAELEPARLAQNAKLRKSVQEEVAWERLDASARTMRRRERDSNEEEARETFAARKSGVTP